MDQLINQIAENLGKREIAVTEKILAKVILQYGIQSEAAMPLRMVSFDSEE